MTDRAVRVPPHSKSAEQAVLGGMMISQKAIDVVAAMLVKDDFYIGTHRAIYQVLIDLDGRGQPCDAVTIGEWLEGAGLSEIVPTDYVLMLANTTPSAANIKAYAAIVKEKSQARTLIDMGSRLIQAAYMPEGRASLDIADEAVREIMSLSKSQRSTIWTMKQAATEAWNQAVKAWDTPGGITGVPSGIAELDEKLGGFHPSDFIVFGGRPKMGKTALLLGCARHAARVGFASGIISGEMAVRQLGARALALESGVRASGLRNGRLQEHEWSALSQSVPKVGALNLWIDDNSMPTTKSVRRTAQQWKQEHDIAALFVDYVQKMKNDEKEENRRISESASTLKEIARELNIPVIALAQVKQTVDDRQDKRPRQGDLYGSDGILKEADIVGMLYRDKYYNPNSNAPDECEILIEANRNGAGGTVVVPWDPKTMKFGGH